MQINKKTYDYIKRGIDISAALTALLLLSPLLIIVAILIRVESKGAVFYKSKRVGQYYKVFDFYKFRSMRTDADKMLAQMQHLNQYETKENTEVKEIESISNYNTQELFSDEGWVSEDSWLTKQENAQPFLKITNDPRITRIGKFIRSTSIDELPQLINVLKGDMSLVGNRPLPVYEAEHLTTDEAISRFAAPAGITGLWQVTERGKAGVSADSRKQLDVEYAKSYSFKLDIWILFKTPLAALQQENV
jgi:lipopolysaccharide/colanic/teichoic acid biosynthesis glycosyltransferase